MEHRLSQIQTQKLTLSPQIRQYLKLLQLPIQQLESVLEQEINENPALDEVSDSIEDQPLLQDEAGSTQTNKENETNEDVSELDFKETLKKLDELDENFKESMYTDFSKTRNHNSEEEEEKRNYLQSLITQEESLSDYLLFQMTMLDLSEEDQRLAAEIIGNVNEDGYLAVPLEDIASSLGKVPESLQTILEKLQTLEPPGVCARNLSECLLLQLKRRKEDTHLAQNIIQNHLPLLEKKDFLKLSKKTKASIDRVKEACQLIAHLDPKPGSIFYREESITVIPDANVYRDDDLGELVIEMNDEPLPRLRINAQFRKMLKDKSLDAKAKEFVKNKVDSAIWLIRALDQRQSTLKEITKKIVESQQEFFDRGFSCLKPLRLKDIGEALSIHESTVSRAISGKYIRTPQGTIPYKSFFSSKMEGVEGPESQKSVMEKIRTLAQNENPAKPLSDEKLVELLNADGLKIARRTVAKYRTLLKILPSHLRKYHR
ncbi:MAG: RNA polymerase factor sigma-54 [Candidatus Omnitrophica bacterium]|nr:RNA polymerase factor sigma-54 [Candidatus Omnitrophota bacterium]